MAKLYIDNPIQSQFAMVPNVLWRWPGLSFKAKGFFAYLLSHRDGSCPPVAAMEVETGLGRDARKAAMAELIRAGLARWVIQRDGSGRLLAKRLEVTTRPLLAAVAADERLAPEKASHGGGRVDKSAVSGLSPEKPADGKHVAASAERRRASSDNPAILQYPKDIEGAHVAASCFGARFASSRSETTRAPAGVVKAERRKEGLGDGVGGEVRSDAERRRAVAASLGLRYFDTAVGRWVEPRQAAEGVERVG